MRRILAAAFLAIAATPLPAQERMTIEVSIVNVDVVVTDRKGAPVRGLTKDDFEIRESGKPRTITNFTEYSSAPLREGDEAAAAATPEKRTIVLFIEAFALPRFSIDPLFDALREAVKKIVRRGDAAAIYTWAGYSTLLRAGFTDEVETLDEKLAEIAEESIGAAANEIAGTSREIAFEHAFYDSVATAGPMGPAAAARGREAAEQSRAMENVEMYKIRRKAEALQSLMRAIAGAEGKKIVISATNRFGMYAGADRFMDGTVPFHVRADFDTRPYREAVARTANAYGITIYPIHPAGMQWTPRGDASQARPDDTALARDNNILMNETSALHELATATGGVMAWGAKDAVSLMPRIVEDLQSYYSLAYRATGASAGKIEVRTKNPAHVVRVRRQRVSVDEMQKLEDRVITNLHRPVDGATLSFDATAGEPDENGLIPVAIRIPAEALTTVGGRGAFTVFIAAGGELGILSEVARRTQEFTPAHESHFLYEVALRADSRTERISIGVLDEVGKDFGLRLVVPGVE